MLNPPSLYQANLSKQMAAHPQSTFTQGFFLSLSFALLLSPSACKWETQCRPALSEKCPEITSVIIWWNIYDLDGDDDDDDDGLVG